MNRPRAWPQGSWRLNQVLVALVYASSLLTFLLVSLGSLLWRLPALEREHRAQIEQQARDFVRREELLVDGLERQLQLAAYALAHTPAAEAGALLDEAVGDGSRLRALAVVDAAGRVLHIGLPPERRLHRPELLGIDVSGHRTVRLLREQPRLSWGAMGLSALSGELTLSAGLPLADGRLLVAEVPTSMLLARALTPPAELAGDPAGDLAVPQLWVIDGKGEVMADTQGQRAVGRLNLLGTPLLEPMPPGGVRTVEIEVEGRRHQAAVADSSRLDWRFVARVPAGLDHPQVRDALLLELGSLAGALLIGLTLAPLVSRRLVGWLQAVVAQTRASALMPGAVPWTATPVHEFNLLAERLATLAEELRDRERRVKAVFDAAPVPMVVTGLGAQMDEAELIDANAAWCAQFGHRREQVLGRRLGELRLWLDPAQAAQAQAGAAGEAHRVEMEALLRHADGRELLCRISGQGAHFDRRWVMIWGTEDITDRRRTEQALRELNQSLEARVAQRTQALEQANEALRATLANLQQTRDELLRAEKLAALGDLVAGIAHELNTPIGNALMAVSTLADEAGEFRRGLAQGLRRSALERLLEGIDLASGLSSRNLQRAADLVSSFKQVAVDQASAQRRRFLLQEVVQEIVLTLRPGFKRTPYTVEVEVEPGIELDSYPGALGQILSNLVTNARVHGFDGREQGRVLVQGRRVEGDAGTTGEQVELVVQDDGVGIAPALIERVFDPFVTTRMGRGGTGLGLHIAHNAATRILGGTLVVRSTPGAGSTFTLRIPARAPVVAPAAAAAS